MSDVEGMIESGMAQLWECEGAASVSEIVSHPREKWLTVWLSGGDMEKLINVLLPKMEAMAKAEGCDRVVLGGRKGWKRALCENGYSEMGLICAKEVR